MSFRDLKLSEPLMRAIDAMGYSDPTPIQERAIPHILDTSDILGIAQTGTGKTAAFGLPILEKLSKKSRRPTPFKPQALILAPTRELALQIHEALEAYGQFTRVKITSIYGGVSMVNQVKVLEAGIDILVATPGRLLDHVRQQTLFLDEVRFLVLDEADRMLDMGFIQDIRKVLSLCTGEKQSMLFSATFSKEIKALAKTLLYFPEVIEIAPNRDVALISQTIYRVEKEHKRDLLRDLIVDNHWEQTLIFTRMKHAASRLAHFLEKDGFTVAAIHGDKTQSARIRALNDFKAKKVQILVATDVAARGIDIEELPHVVNFELPANAEDYVHRIGRTGRAGSTGEAVSFMSRDDEPLLAAIEKLLNKKLPVITPEGLEKREPQEIVEVPTVKKTPRKRPTANDTKPARSAQRTPAKEASDRRPRREPTRERIRETKAPRSTARRESDISFDYVLPDFDFQPKKGRKK